MDEQTILSHTTTALTLVLVLSLPPIIVATVVGVLVSLLQALTQVQDQTLGFAFKLIAVILTIVFFGAPAGAELYQYAYNLFGNFYMMVP